MGRKAQKNDSLPGSLDMLILRTLSLRDLHGYGIVQFIQQSSDNELLVEEGSLYPALQRLELNGWIDGVWGVTSNNRRARIYKITAAGRKQRLAAPGAFHPSAPTAEVPCPELCDGRELGHRIELLER